MFDLIPLIRNKRADDRLERTGREVPGLQRQRSRRAGMARTAALLVIGDELLAGKVADSNSGFLVKKLHALGWAVSKVVVLPDHAEAIAQCAPARLLPFCLSTHRRKQPDHTQFATRTTAV